MFPHLLAIVITKTRLLWSLAGDLDWACYWKWGEEFVWRATQHHPFLTASLSFNFMMIYPDASYRVNQYNFLIVLIYENWTQSHPTHFHVVHFLFLWDKIMIYLWHLAPEFPGARCLVQGDRKGGQVGYPWKRLSKCSSEMYFSRSLVHSSRKLWQKPNSGNSVPCILPCKIGGSWNLMKERYLSKTPFLILFPKIGFYEPV